MSSNRRIDILGAKVDNIKFSKLIKVIKKSLRCNIKTKIFTPNTQIILKAKNNPRLLQVLNSAEISIPDSVGVLLASRIIGQPISSRISGIDLAEKILELSNKEQYKIYLLGGEKNVAKIAAKNLSRKYNNLKICGSHDGYFNLEGYENYNIIKNINSSKADILFVCMGFPRQEKWICNNISKLGNVKIAIGLGGSIDVWAGRLKRAPKIFRILWLEWLWRILIEIKRVKFFLEIPCFIFYVVKKSLIKRKKNGKNAHIKPNFNKK